MEVAVIMSRSKVLVVVAAAVLLASVVHPAQGARVTQLGAVNVLEASRSTTLRVHIARPATLAFDSSRSVSPAVSIEGRGRFVGISLARVGTDQSQGQWFTQLRFYACGAANCPENKVSAQHPVAGQQLSSFVGFPESENVPSFSSLTFQPGMYDLDLIADSAPVRVTLRLTGLAGTRRLPVQGPSRTETVEQAATLTPNETAPAGFSVGAARRFESPLGVLAYSLAYKYDVSTGNVADWCLYDGQRPRATPWYLPGCPGSTKTVATPGFIITQKGTEIPRGGYGIVLVLGEQVWDQGLSDVGANLIEGKPTASFLFAPVGA